MVEKRLTTHYANNNIGENLFKNKPQKLCVDTHYYQKESSNKSDFQSQLLRLASYFGLMFQKEQPPQKTDSVSQEPKIGQNADLRKQRQSPSANYDKTPSNFTVDFDVVRLKIGSFLVSIWTDKRLRWGLLLLLVVAPISKLIYVFFPEDGFGTYFISTQFITVPNFIETPDVAVEDGGWYWQTLYFWFWMCSEIWAPLIAIYGIFLLFPKKYYPSYLVGIPFGYFLSLLIHRMFVSTYEEFHMGYGAAVMAMWIILGVVIFVVSDQILFKKNHVTRATEARMVGLINMPGMSWEEKEVLLKKEAESWTSEQNELYDEAKENKQNKDTNGGESNMRKMAS